MNNKEDTNTKKSGTSTSDKKATPVEQGPVRKSPIDWLKVFR